MTREQIKAINDAMKVSKRKIRILESTYGQAEEAAKERAVLQDLKNQLKQ